MESNFYIIPAMLDKDTYFLFRDYAIEIKFTIINGILKVHGNHYLLPAEVDFIKKAFF